MTWVNTDYLIIGIIVGYILNPLLAVAIAIISNAWKSTRSSCTGDCNQGRNCTCGSK